ncbi:unnamed protein product [Adineta ricciae]|uniref:NADH-ubiquinone oxidoreductase 9 kDa subunit n=1 Tax=Adineta ricciae TaxID=249248 RepID=A0A816A4M5_ADIRI|nr:unnamed protein product [Adineta ricciae]CAF1591993.1 unnamed protein product [Adineta ricciae]
MISNQILRSSSSMMTRFIPLSTRFGSTLSKQASSNQDKSANKSGLGKSSSEYLADDMYNYTTFSYYDIEASMTSYRLPQPNPHTPLKTDPAPQKK